jgi:hypothetical protein
MRFLLAAVVLAPVVALVVGAVRGRVQVRSCCGAASDDLRMRAAYPEQLAPPR